MTAIGFGKLGRHPDRRTWNGDSTTHVGVFRPRTATFYLANTTTGIAAYTYGSPTDKPLTYQQ